MAVVFMTTSPPPAKTCAYPRCQKKGVNHFAHDAEGTTAGLGFLCPEHSVIDAIANTCFCNRHNGKHAFYCPMHPQNRAAQFHHYPETGAQPYRMRTS